jgi:hypothetical protein
VKLPFKITSKISKSYSLPIERSFYFNTPRFFLFTPRTQDVSKATHFYFLNLSFLSNNTSSPIVHPIFKIDPT